jgi:membrane protein implicated in regulation of membrane protease activity
MTMIRTVICWKGMKAVHRAVLCNKRYWLVIGFACSLLLCIAPVHMCLSAGRGPAAVAAAAAAVLLFAVR